MSIEFGQPRSEQELEQVEAAFDEASRTLTGPMSEVMFDQAKTLSMMRRLYDLGYREDYDFSHLALPKLIALVGIIGDRVAAQMLLTGEDNQDLRGAAEGFSGG